MQVLTDLLTLDTSRLIFDQAKKVVKPKYFYHKIPIRIKHENGEGPLYIMLKDVQSFGVNSFQGEGKKAHSISIKLWDKPTEEQALWRRKFEELVQTCVNYVVHKKKKIGVSVRRSDLEGPRGGASPLKYAVSDDGEEQVRVVDSAPRLYPKLKSDEGRWSLEGEVRGQWDSRRVAPRVSGKHQTRLAEVRLGRRQYFRWPPVQEHSGVRQGGRGQDSRGGELPGIGFSREVGPSPTPRRKSGQLLVAHQDSNPRPPAQETDAPPPLDSWRAQGPGRVAP